MPEVVAVLTGRFERNPPLFYEMRLERVTDHLQSHPEDLAAYDDAGVACDRLGRGDEAISWMEKKRCNWTGSTPRGPRSRSSSIAITRTSARSWSTDGCGKGPIGRGSTR